MFNIHCSIGEATEYRGDICADIEQRGVQLNMYQFRIEPLPKKFLAQN